MSGLLRRHCPLCGVDRPVLPSGKFRVHRRASVDAMDCPASGHLASNDDGALSRLLAERHERTREQDLVREAWAAARASGIEAKTLAECIVELDRRLRRSHEDYLAERAEHADLVEQNEESCQAFDAAMRAAREAGFPTATPSECIAQLSEQVDAAWLVLESCALARGELSLAASVRALADRADSLIRELDRSRAALQWIADQAAEALEDPA